MERMGPNPKRTIIGVECHHKKYSNLNIWLSFVSITTENNKIAANVVLVARILLTLIVI